MSPPTTPRIFLSFARQDAKYREIVTGKVGQSRLPFAVDALSEGAAETEEWQTDCRRRIAGSRGVVVLLSRHTRHSVQAMWQVQCAREEGIPVVGVLVGVDLLEESLQAEVLDPISVMGWRWKNIESMLLRLTQVQPVEAGQRGQRSRAATVAGKPGATAGSAHSPAA